MASSPTADHTAAGTADHTAAGTTGRSADDAAGGATPLAAAVEPIAVAFARVLRGAGLRVPIGSVLTFAEALAQLGLGSREPVYWAARTTLVRRPEDLELFDQAFAVFWEHRLSTGADESATEPMHITIALDDGPDDDGADDPEEPGADDDPTIQLRFSATEVLRNKDFAAYSPDELQLAHELMARLRFVGTPRRSRRLVNARRVANRPDLRRTVRAALRSGGEPIRREWREPGIRMRRLVLLLDVSGSMEPYARALLRFVQAAVAGRQRVEAFALGTRLTRLTRELSSHDPDLALAQAGDRVQDWSGGTRLGACLRRFNDEWGARGTARGAIIVILSDGWDRGEPEELASEMQRLQRVAHQVVWVNPLKVTPGYAPLARGMAAALPYVDNFVEGHSVAALEELTRVIGGERA